MELGKLFYKLALNNMDEFEDDINKSSNLFNKLGEAALKVGKIIVTGVTAGAAAIGFLTKQSVEAYGEYEQLVGGVEKLFDKSAEKIKQYAATAYLTAGMSSNTYMDTITSFSAALLMALGDDTDTAVEIANIAMQDMADNANTFGQGIDTTRAVYQSLARGQYMLLDNLRLGVKGSQEGMIELINRAGILEEKITSLDGIGFDTMILAIHEVQKQLGITGTTAMEAGKTIQGSLNSFKAAWENVLIGMGDDSQDFGKLLDNLVVTIVGDGTDEFLGILGNIIPTIKTIFSKIPQLIEGLVPYIPEILSGLLPGLIEASIILIKGLIQALPDLIKKLVEEAPQFVKGFMDIFNEVVVHMPEIIAPLLEAIPGVVTTIVEEFFGNIDPAIESGIILVGSLVTAWETFNFLAYIGQMGGLSNAIKALSSSVWGNIAAKIADKKETLIINAMYAKDAVVKGLLIAKTIALTVATKAQTLAITALNAVMNANPMTLVIVGIGLLVAAFMWLWNTSEGFREFWINLWEKIKETASNVVESIKKFFTETILNAFNNFKDKVTTTFEGVRTAIVSPIEKAKDVVWGIVEKIKGFFSGMKLSFPDIKLPHFSVKPKGWKIADLLKGSIPKLAIDWYAEGAILNEPTIFGYNPSTNRLKVGGEAGAEAITPIDKLQGYVSKAVSDENIGVIEAIDRLIAMLNHYLPQLLAKEGNVMLNGDALVGYITPGINKKLGDMYLLNERGG